MRPLDPRQDGKLLAEVAAISSQTAFEELLHRHGRMVFNECRRLLADTHDAEDAAQAVFLVLWKKAKSLRGRPTVATWLHRVAQTSAGTHSGPKACARTASVKRWK